MRFILRRWTIGLLAAACLAGCGTQSTPVAEVDTNDPMLADGMDSTEGLPLLAVPGPDSKSKSGKVTQTAAKSAPSLLPKGLFGKKATQNDAADDADSSASKGPEKGSPEWLLNEIQRVRLMPFPQEAAQAKNKDDDADDQPLTPAQEKKFAQDIERTRGIRRERNLQIIKEDQPESRTGTAILCGRSSTAGCAAATGIAGGCRQHRFAIRSRKALFPKKPKVGFRIRSSIDPGQFDSCQCRSIWDQRAALVDRIFQAIADLRDEVS
jgi:hypothetical protein